MSFGNILYSTLIGPLQLFFEVVYSIAYRVIGNEGLSIIVLSLAMNFLVLPLYKRADEVQAEERAIEAKLKRGVDHIKKTFHGDDRMMMLQTYYRQNNYSPVDSLKGSVSLLLEIPFFIAAYRFLSGLEILQGVSFGPIADLGMPDNMLVLGSFSINILPILMTIINIISSSIYSKGLPLKSKIQLYAMACIFLVFLYNSPAGLVFYWTLNNLFSLVKTVFFKMKNPKVILSIMASVAGLAAAVIAIIGPGSRSVKVYLVLAIAGIILQMPLLIHFLGRNRKWALFVSGEPSKTAFLFPCLLLSVLIGFLIPSSVILASPLEFVDAASFYNPVWYVISSLSLAGGLFIVWFFVFYSLAGKSGKIIFEKLVSAVSVIAIADYMLFGKKLGIMNSSLIFDKGLQFDKKEMVINILVILICIITVLAALRFLKSKAKAIYLIMAVAVFSMSISNIAGINKVISEYRNTSERGDIPTINLSREGENVVVIMLDRAIGLYVPYIMAERPELKEQFSGFTYYSNVVSFGGWTNLGTPALFGGYEYTPDEMNKRDTESIKDKHNEALKVMPVLFAENGFDVTVLNPSYANYQWIPDNSIFADYDGIYANNTYGYFSDPESSEYTVESRKRNFFCYSFMKAMPLFMQSTLYNAGKYNSLAFYSEKAYLGQSIESISESEGISPDAADYYNTVSGLSGMTHITDETNGTFTEYVCELTHDVQLYDEETYSLEMHVDNAAYDNAHADRFEIAGRTLKVESIEQMTHYQSNVAAFIQLGKWFEYLKANGVYDNTRIILVADHGQGLSQDEELIVDYAESRYDAEWYYPLLMVKDFNSTGFCESEEFMTNADVPVLATRELISNPVNPFTGNEIENSYKTLGVYVSASDAWGINFNNGSVYYPGDWLYVHDDMRKKENWEIVQRDSASPLEFVEWDEELWERFHNASEKGE